MLAERPPAPSKAPTGIQGLDEITGGGLPAGRPTLICGTAGCGKTMLAMEFLVRGATQFGEPGVFMMFEENAAELSANVRSLGFDLEKLAAQNMILLDYVHIERSEIEETGEYNLEGLFIRLGHAIDSIGAKRVVLDTVEALFSGLPNHAILRAELRRLFRWLKDRGMTAVITGEKGDATITRYGLEEYVADCVIVLDQRIAEQICTRRLRVVKYRGTAHGTNEYPFLIGERGFSVLPITSLHLDHKASAARVPTGIARLDEMLGGKGVFRGSSVLVSGSPGTGKSSIGAKFVDAACRRGENALLFAYEESSAQIVRNMRSIGIDLEPWIEKGLLEIHASRPTLHGLEQHLVMMHDAVRAFRPSVVAVDPISNLTLGHHDLDVKPTLMRLIDFLKQQQITTLFTCLSSGGWRDTGGLAARRVVAHGYLAAAAQCGVQRRAQPHDLRAEIARHGALESSARVRPERPGHRPGGCLCRGRPRAHRHRARGAGDARAHRRRGAPAGSPAQAAAARRQTQSDRGTDRRAASRGGIGSGGGELRHRAADLAGANHAAEHPGHGAAARRRRRRQRPDEGRAITDMTLQVARPAPATAAAAAIFELRLYVAGQTAKSIAAIANLKRICETHLAGKYRIEVIDLTKTPQLAAGDQIIAVPTLVRRLPEPVKKILGDLSNEERVLVGLDVQPART